MEELRHTVQFAKSHGALVIIDVKRGDIASSAIAYGAAYLGPASAFGGDAITVSPYLGTGSLTPIFDIAVRQEAGVFVVVRSTNPEGIELQEAILGDGRAVWENISDNITAYNLGVMSSQSIGPIGAVVGATLGQNAALIADRLPNALMLVPGIGAQGANLQDVKSHFGSHYSRVIPSISRSIASAGPNADALNRSVQQSAYLAR
jgi:orotidine-5'-phosphate decarboxylase